MEASLAAIERKQRAASPQAAARAPERARTPERAKSPAKAPTPTPAQAQSKTAADPLDGWSGWGDTEASLAEIERKQQQSQQRNQRNATLYGNSGNSGTGAARTKRYESVSSDDFAQQQQGQGPQPGARSFQAYGPGAGPASYQQGATPALADALSSGWSRLSSLAKTVAQQTQRAVHDSGILDAVHGLVSGTGAAEQGTQRASLLGDSHQQQQQAQQQQRVSQRCVAACSLRSQRCCCTHGSCLSACGRQRPLRTRRRLGHVVSTRGHATFRHSAPPFPISPSFIPFFLFLLLSSFVRMSHGACRECASLFLI